MFTFTASGGSSGAAGTLNYVVVDPRGNATSQSIQMSASDAPQSISFGALTGGNSQADQTWTIQDTAGNTLATATINIDELVGLTLDHFNPDPVPNAGGIEMHVEAVGSVSNPNQLDDPLSFAWTVVDIGGNPVGITDEGDHIVFGANPHGKYTVDLTVSDNYGNSQQGELSVDFSGGSNNPYNSDPNNDPNNSDPNNPNNNNPNNGDPNGDDPLPQDPDPQPDPPPAPPVDPNPVAPQPDPTQPTDPTNPPDYNQYHLVDESTTDYTSYATGATRDEVIANDDAYDTQRSKTIQVPADGVLNRLARTWEE